MADDFALLIGQGRGRHDMSEPFVPFDLQNVSQAFHGDEKGEVIVQELPIGSGLFEDFRAGAFQGIKGIGDREFPPQSVFTGFVVICSGVELGHDEKRVPVLSFHP